MRGCLGRLLRWGLLFLLLLAVGAGLAWRRASRAIEDPLAFAAPGELRTFVVAPGESTRGILARLEAEGLLRSALLARLYQSRWLGDPPLQAGEYRFRSPISTRELLRKLRSGEVATDPVTVVEGLDLAETAQAIAAAGFAAPQALAAAFADPAPIRALDPAALDLEGYLFPDTYRFPRAVDAGTIATALAGAFRRHWQREIAPLLPPGDRRPLREVVILASLVEKEAKQDEERPLIAAVYANRLARGIGLYADPTIIHGLKLAGAWDGNLRRRDLESDSPWNSYRRPGLPPGPICSPGLASLAAAARPAEVGYLYFVSRNDGTHAFSITLAEHNRNVEHWQREYFRRRRN